MMNRVPIVLGVFICLSIGPLLPAGDSLWGKITEVKRADLVTLDYGAGSYDLRLIGIDVPREGLVAERAREFVAGMVLGKNARMRFEWRGRNGEMWSRLFTDDPELGIKEIAVELVKAGLAARQQGYDFKYGELAAAERDARRARRGMWSTTRR
jgi:endonuclease YncB( thermonuclease family)